MQQGSRGARHRGLDGRCSGSAQGASAPATDTVGDFKVCLCSSVGKFINHESKRHLIHLNRKDVIRTVRLQRRSKV